VLVLIACLAVAPSSQLAAFAAPGQSAEQLSAQLEKLKRDTKEAGDEWDKAYWRLDEVELKVDKTDKEIARTKEELAAARALLGLHAAAIYRRSQVSPVEVLVGASSFEELVTRVELMRRIGKSDADTVAEVKRVRDKLNKQRSRLASEKRDAKDAVVSLKAQRDRLQAKLKSKEAEFAKVKAELDAVRGGSNRPSGQAAVAGPNGMVFPVVGSYYYSDTWGASRGGGRRRHQGTDIMAPRGTPVVAILPGTVSSKTGGLGGKTIWLSANNGWSFYYAHLDGWAVRSGSVKAGQIIGYVGSTGNAAGGAPHLHLQIQPGGSPVNPYPYLRRME
jgi:murein DD-endopeptidase MepM/ murein hydrolase activator NlpD